MTTIHLFNNSSVIENFTAGAVIFHKGDTGHCLYSVLVGQVDLILDGELIETVECGGIFGEMALIDNGSRSTSAIARTDCTVACVDEKGFNYMVQTTPFFALNVMRIMSERLRHANLRLVQS